MARCNTALADKIDGPRRKRPSLIVIEGQTVGGSSPKRVSISVSEERFSEIWFKEVEVMSSFLIGGGVDTPLKMHCSEGGTLWTEEGK